MIVSQFDVIYDDIIRQDKSYFLRITNLEDKPLKFGLKIHFNSGALVNKELKLPISVQFGSSNLLPILLNVISETIIYVLAAEIPPQETFEYKISPNYSFGDPIKGTRASSNHLGFVELILPALPKFILGNKKSLFNIEPQSDHAVKVLLSAFHQKRVFEFSNSGLNIRNSHIVEEEEEIEISTGKALNEIEPEQPFQFEKLLLIDNLNDISTEQMEHAAEEKQFPTPEQDKRDVAEFLVFLDRIQKNPKQVKTINKIIEQAKISLKIT